MLRNYRVAVAWRDATGHPVEGARETVEAELNKKCARFAEIDAIFNKQPGIAPASGRESLRHDEEAGNTAAVSEGNPSSPPPDDTRNRRACQEAAKVPGRSRLSAEPWSVVVHSSVRKLPPENTPDSQQPTGREKVWLSRLVVRPDPPHPHFQGRHLR
jgi:hypothetical protein